MITKQSIDRLLESCDIVDIIEHYIPLRKSGSNFVGLCPFHDDKNPSMSVNANKGFFHCFSCKAGGNAIKFVMDYEKLSFPQAVEKVAELSNFTLEYSFQNMPKKENKFILEKANSYYKSELSSNQRAIEYLRSRGFDNELIEKFELGWAPHSANTIRLLENEKIDLNEALEVGIIKKNDKGFYASFIDRITFPIKNHTGKLVGFGGRTIDNHPAKYVNSPDCVVFDKSSILYAYDIAKLSKKDTLIITEGYMDTIMLHKAGFDNAVAVLGTALTKRHLPLLRRLGKGIILSFDGDGAGINAAFKSAKLLSTNGLDSSVVLIPNGADPADMVCAGKIDELEKIYSNSTESGKFVIKTIASNYDLNRPQQVKNALDEIVKFTNSLDRVVANSYKEYVANLLRIDIASFSLSGSTRVITTPNSKNLIPQKRDFAELEILKFALNNAGFLPSLSKIKKFFITHQKLCDEVLSSTQSPSIRELELDENIKEISKDMLSVAVINLNIRYNIHLINMIKISDSPDKLRQIMNLNRQIKELKGKL
ncbi:MAG: DNA primase [Campylobacter sp.]|nr:DNA primase [Campylobacter sp.]